ncbi:Serine/threonine protein kinase [uncultured Gammaproteobacteria bacterium]
MANEPSSSGDGSRAAAQPVQLGDRCEIMPDTPIPDLDSPGGTAYAARRLRGSKSEAFALICHGTMAPRLEMASTLTGMDSQVMVKLQDWGVVDWPDGTGRRMALVFERPNGRRMMPSLTDTVEPIAEDVLTRLVVQPALTALRELSSRGFTHGAVRPTNMFLRDINSGGFQLGECVSAPPGYAQPLLLETIERSMAMPAGRGPGTILDDIYSLGVSLLILLLGRNPVLNSNDEQVLLAKIERGSYPALIAGARIPTGINEALRGMTVDDPKQRWNLEQIDLWLSGRRLSPKQPQLPKRATRPLEFRGEDYWNCRALARGLAAAPAAAVPLIESGDLERWMRRSLGDEPRTDAVTQAIQSVVGDKSPNLTDRMAARTCIALDPQGPIRYKGKSVMPDGIGGAIADAFLRRESPQHLVEILLNQMPLFWVSVQGEFRPEFGPMTQLCDSLRNALERLGPGYGVERVLYEVSPMMHCLSPIVARQHAMTPIDLLQGLDAAATEKDRPREQMDRHIIAFLAARHRRLDDTLLAQLGSGIDPMRRMVAMMTIYTDIQVRNGTPPLPNLCGWFVSLMEPVVSRFHHRPRREEVRKQAEIVARAGRLAELIRICDNPEAIRTDQAGFAIALRDYRGAEAEINKLRKLLSNRTALVEGNGRQVAAMIAGGTATLLTIAIVIMLGFG